MAARTPGIASEPALRLVAEPGQPTMVLTRVFDAPRRLVFEAHKPEHVSRWWGGRRHRLTVCEMDFRPGGAWRFVLHGPDGTDYPNRSVFIEVVKPERIVFSHGGGREGGPGTHFEATWTFDALEGNKTRATARMVFESAADRERVVEEFGAIEGGHQTLGRLAGYLAKMA